MKRRKKRNAKPAVTDEMVKAAMPFMVALIINSALSRLKPGESIVISKAPSEPEKT